jgi:hypothetical protein
MISMGKLRFNRQKIQTTSNSTRYKDEREKKIINRGGTITR